MANVTSSSQKDKSVQGTLGEKPHKDDLVLVTDRSDGKGSASGTQKYATIENLMLAASGLQGPAGPTGAQGVSGQQGQVGPEGAQGVAGQEGPQGTQGEQGIQGVKGDKGEPGASGAVGTQGPAGGSGAQGTTGPQGATSPAGLTWKGSWVAGDAYQVNNSVGYNGASYFCVVANSDTTNPDSTPNWALLAAQGATGPAGADGAQGPVGSQGPAGPEGPEGAQGVGGPQGVAGVAGSQGAQGAIGSQGPAGIDGIQGVAGPAGEQGPAGPQGPGGTTDFTELDQMPDNLNPGAYLRVNDSGDGLVNVMTAPSTSRVGQAEDVRDAVPLASSIELPDAILDHDAGENTTGGDARLLIFEKYTDDHFQYHAANTSSYYVRFDATTGARVYKSSNSNGDFDTIQEYISNGKALYFGGTGQTGAVTVSAGDLTDGNFDGEAILGFDASINDQTGTAYTLLASDNGKVVVLNNGSAVTVTVPSGLGVGFNCSFIQKGAGQVSFSASSTTINNRQSHTKINAQYGVASIVAYAADTFVLAGDTAS